MPSSYSPLLRFEEIGAGEQSGLWGDTTNKNIGELVEQAIAGVTTVSLSGGAGSYTLSALNGALDESRGAVLKFIGTPSGAKNIIIPTSTKLYVVRNECGQTIVVKTAAQVGGITILTGEATLVFCDGTSAVAGIATAGVGPTTVANGGTGATGFGAGGFIKSPGTTGTLTAQAAIGLNSADVTGTLPVTSGGTGATNFTSGGLLKGAGGSAVTSLVGTVNGQIVTWDGVQGWTVTTPSSGVESFSGGTTGLTPSTATTGAVTLAGTLAVSNGGTGATTGTAARVNLGIGTVATVNLPSPSSTSTFLRGDGTFATPPAGGSGTVTSVAVSGGTTGLTTSGGPITSSGTITLAGTLAIANGGTGSSTKNFIDLTTAQTVAGLKTFSSDINVTSGGGFAGLQQNAVTVGSALTGMSSIGTVNISWQIQNVGVMQVTSAGSTFNITGTYAAFSDARAKENIVPARSYLNDLCKLNVVNYNFKNTTNKLLGFVAQDVEKVMPGLVESIENKNYPEIKDFKAVKTSVLIPMLVQSVQELSAKIDAQAAKITALEEQVLNLSVK